jgi:hypothetical protein
VLWEVHAVQVLVDESDLFGLDTARANQLHKIHTAEASTLIRVEIQDRVGMIRSEHAER